MHNFSRIFLEQDDIRTSKKEEEEGEESIDDPFWFSLLACCYTDDLFLIIEIGCLRARTGTFFFLSLVDIFMMTSVFFYIDIEAVFAVR